jgi:type III restriction enzyme
VANYREYDEDGNQKLGKYGQIFEEEYKSILNEYRTLFPPEYTNYLNRIDVHETHNGYFSIDKRQVE